MLGAQTDGLIDSVTNLFRVVQVVAFPVVFTPPSFFRFSLGRETPFAALVELGLYGRPLVFPSLSHSHSHWKNWMISVLTLSSQASSPSGLAFGLLSVPLHSLSHCTLNTIKAHIEFIHNNFPN